jgi:hypothetical protein
MMKWFQGKERDYTVTEVEGSSEKLPKNQRLINLKDLT